MSNQETLEKLPETLYIAFYNGSDGQETRGEWKSSEENIDEEIQRYRRADYRWNRTCTLSKKSIEDTAKELNMSVAEVLKAM